MSVSEVSAVRHQLGRVGFFLPAALDSVMRVGAQRDLVRRVEQAGSGTVWVNEGVGGKDALVQLALLLEATDALTLGTGIANIWARPPQTMHAAASQLAEAHPGRVVLGIGVGHPEQAASVGRAYGRPTATLRDYLTAMDDAPATPGRYARILGANGPAMLSIAAARADGAFPAMRPVAFTEQARRTLGPDKLLVVMERLDLDPATTRTSVAEHLQAGADHVALGLPLGVDLTAGAERIEHAAAVLLS